MFDLFPYQNRQFSSKKLLFKKLFSTLFVLEINFICTETALFVLKQLYCTEPVKIKLFKILYWKFYITIDF